MTRHSYIMAVAVDAHRPGAARSVALGLCGGPCPEARMWAVSPKEGRAGARGGAVELYYLGKM